MASSQTYQSVLHVADSALCCVVFFPAMVFYWRGIWDLWGVYIFPGQHPKQQWVLLIISLTSILGYFIAPLLEKSLDRHNKLLYFVLSRGYGYLYAAMYMCFWRSIWDLADHYLAMDIVSSAINVVCTYGVLIIFRASRCCIFPPMFTNLDTRDDFLAVTTRFGTKPFTVKYVADAFFSHVFLLGLTVLSWRGLWNFQGSFIFPDDATFSDFFCLGLGYALTILLFLLEEPLASVTVWMVKRGFYYKLIWEDSVYTAIFFCNAILWRGGWNLTATYIFPDVEVGGWFCFTVGTMLLTLVQLFSYVCAHGIAIDGSDSGRNAFYPTKYLRVYVKRFHTKIEGVDRSTRDLSTSDEPISVIPIRETVGKDHNTSGTTVSTYL